MSLASPSSTPATSPMPLNPTFASALIPPSPNPAHAAPTGQGSTARPLLPSRLSTTSGPSRTDDTSVVKGKGKIPSRYSSCELCALVREARAMFGHASRPNGRSAPDGLTGGSSSQAGLEWGSNEAGPSTASSSSSSPIRASTAPFAQPGPPGMSPASPTSQTISGREILYHDSDITIYPAVGKERLRADGRHLIIVINTHAENVYDLGPTDVPLLSKIIETAQLLLDPSQSKGELRVGFLGSVMRDPQSPHAHLHAHALLGPPDTSLPGATFWRRNVVFGWGNWWSVQDLRAEIREGSSNNRIKSGYENRSAAPIDKVPAAGSHSGLPNALDPPPPDPYHSPYRSPSFDGSTPPSTAV